MANYKGEQPDSDHATMHQCPNCGEYSYKLDWYDNSPIAVAFLAAAILAVVASITGFTMIPGILIIIIFIASIASKIRDRNKTVFKYKCGNCNYENYHDHEASEEEEEEESDTTEDK